MKASRITFALGLLGIVACSSTGPEGVLKDYFDCQKKKDSDCTLRFLDEKLIANNGGPIVMKTGLDRGFKDTNNFNYTIDRQAIGANTAEAEVTIVVYNLDGTKFEMRELITLSKSADGKWLISEIGPVK